MPRAAPALALTAAFFLPHLPALAQDAPPIVPPPPPEEIEAPADVPTPAARELTRADLETWLDGFLPYALERGDIAGAVVAVVRDGQVLLQKGYGYSDVEKRTPVDPARTLFRPGSVSKLFTWTAVMQQVERGKLDLDTDVSTYIDFELPPGPDGKPITLRHLMTHTPGFEESVKELIVDDPERLPPSLREALVRWIPERIYPAGTMPAYSNWGTALAGHLVERVSGERFEDYIDRNILEPLGMSHSTFRQPLPEALEADMSEGYTVGSGDPQAFELIPIAPAGSLSATGADMAAFMIAHLQAGAYRDARILSEKTARMMHSTALTVILPLNRMLLGFYESNVNGRRVIAHGGDTQYFHSTLHLFVDDGVGLFFSTNSTGKEGAAQPIRATLFDEFADRYLPAVDAGEAPITETAVEHAALIAGTWWNSRRIDTNLVSLLNLISAIKVIPDEDGTISVPLLRGLNGEPRKWRETAPFIWTEVDGESRLAAEVVDGRITRFSVDDISPFMMFERPPAAKSNTWLMPATAVSLAILLLTLIQWPIAALVRRRFERPLALEGRDRRAYRLVRIGIVASAGAILAWGATVIAMLENLSMMTTTLDPWLWALHVLGTLAVIAGFGVAVWNVGVVWRGRRGWFSKTWSVLIALATFVLLWVAFAFHLVGLDVSY